MTELLLRLYVTALLVIPIYGSCEKRMDGDLTGDNFKTFFNGIEDGGKRNELFTGGADISPSDEIKVETKNAFGQPQYVEYVSIYVISGNPYNLALTTLEGGNETEITNKVIIETAVQFKIEKYVDGVKIKTITLGTVKATFHGCFSVESTTPSTVPTTTSTSIITSTISETTASTMPQGICEKRMDGDMTGDNFKTFFNGIQDGWKRFELFTDGVNISPSDEIKVETKNNFGQPQYVEYVSMDVTSGNPFNLALTTLEGGIETEITNKEFSATVVQFKIEKYVDGVKIKTTAFATVKATFHGCFSVEPATPSTLPTTTSTSITTSTTSETTASTMPQEVVLHGKCDDDAACRDNAECVLSACQCKRGYYDDNGDQQKGNCIIGMDIGQVCSEIVKCKDTNAHCILEGKEGICTCKDNFFANTSVPGGQCDHKVELGAECNITENCDDKHATCNGNLCVCSADYYDSNGPRLPAGTCLKKIILGGLCDSEKPCYDKNAVCFQSECICKPGYFDNNGRDYNGICHPKVALGHPCTFTLECKTPHSKCRPDGKICSCEDGYYDTNSQSTSGGLCLKKVELNEECSPPKLCADKNAICGRGIKCVCNASHYDSNGPAIGGTCVEKIILGGACTETRLCADITNGECISGVCRCKDTHYDNNGVSVAGGSCVPRVALGSYCSDTVKCAHTIAMCNASRVCVCTDTYFDSNGASPAGTCLLKVRLGSNCSSYVLCADKNTKPCTGDINKCTCLDSYYDDDGSPPGGRCIKRIPLGGLCNDIKLCADTNTECLLSACQCKHGYYKQGDECIKGADLGHPCTPHIQCTDSNANCGTDGGGGNCTCKPYYYENNTIPGGQCVGKVDLGDSCDEKNNCREINAVCNNGKCICKNTHYDSNGQDKNGGICINKVPLGGRCDAVAICADMEGGECINEVCQCRKTHYDHNGEEMFGMCIKRISLGGTCTNIRLCLDVNSICNNNVCTCKSTHYQDNVGLCKLKSRLGSDCHSPMMCDDDNALCSVSKKCECASPYYDSNGHGNPGGSCKPKIRNGGKCDDILLCKDPYAVCQIEACSCDSDTHYDSNGVKYDGKCIRKKALHEHCSITVPCMSKRAECRSGTCQCPANDYHELKGECLENSLSNAEKTAIMVCVGTGASLTFVIPIIVLIVYQRRKRSQK